MKHKSTWHLFHWIMIVIFIPWVLVYIACWASNSSYNAKQKLAMQQENLDVNKELLYYLKQK